MEFEMIGAELRGQPESHLYYNLDELDTVNWTTS